MTIYTTCEPADEWDRFEIQIIQLPEDDMVHTAMMGVEFALFDADIIFVSQIIWPYTYQATKVKEKFGKKVIALHSDTTPFAREENKAVKFFKEESRPLVDVYVADTIAAKEALIIEGVSRDKIAVIPIGVNIDDWSAALQVRKSVRSRLNLAERDKVVLISSDPVKEDEILDLVYAAELLHRFAHPIHQNVKYLIDSRAKEPKNITAAIEKLGLDHRFVYHPGNTLYELFNTADMLYLPSLPDSSWKAPSTMILRKAMAFGLPIIAAAVANIPDIAGDAAILIPRHNPGAICSAIMDLLRSDKYRTALAKKAKQRAFYQFSCDKTSKKMRELFQTIIQEK